ncbi:MAG TPA: hypothetical protein ENN30_01225 [Candidatus Woesearchaeota archaeon]|nr:hypothetical protein [Candidatus Woesearchaeota archaeon]
MNINDYELELENVKKEIKRKNVKSVLVELPDGVKPFGTMIADSLKETGAEIYIWADSCFGACDVPRVDMDMIVQLGHNKFRQSE